MRLKQSWLIRLFTLLMASLLAAVSIISCAKKTSQPTVEATREPSLLSTNTDLPTLTSSITTSTVTQPAPTLMPLPTDVLDEELEAGLFILAMGDGQYHHLFAYHPVYFPFTRISTGEWDYDDPAISPDGTRIAYCTRHAGNWNIAILDLQRNIETQVTKSSTYACAPSWSPDGQWLVYESVADGRLDIFLQSVTDLSIPPYRLTDTISNNFDPVWSPGGRKIAFVTDRTSRHEIWIADLDAPTDRMTAFLASEEADFASPHWSIDGKTLLYQKNAEQKTIEKKDVVEIASPPLNIGTGSLPTWATNNNGILAVLQSPNGYELVSYRKDPTRVLFPSVHLPDQVTAITWQSGAFVEHMKTFLTAVEIPASTTLYMPENMTQDPASGLVNRIYLDGIEAPEPYLSDAVNDNFNSLRSALEYELGWDFLGILENGSIALPDEPQAQKDEDWLYTGRAIAVNLAPLDAEWMTTNREDYNGRTYWRLWLKCREQNGTCGTPIKTPVWDFSARYNGDNEAFENGGQYSSPPAGYWLDFTAYALRYGWERLPADSNWRSYFPATQINIFVRSEGLTWQQAMRERYPAETIERLWP